ncbi:chemotaxis response regulator protein-glutamate methylesterase [Psychrosphaera sp.]|nr:chemotaxis response regulator protein-glutamate methylesterase [Psychrosphaera sp.]
MTIKVLVVDDSAFFRRRVTEILNAHTELEVVGDASNGKDAISQTALLKPDVVTMDIEMPVMDGITAVAQIMASTPTPIIMFSSLTHDGAKATLNALEAGALDFLPKRFEDIAKNKTEGIQLLQDRVLQLGKKKVASRRTKESFISRTSAATPLSRTPNEPRTLRGQPASPKQLSTTLRARTRAAEPIKNTEKPQSFARRGSFRASGKEYKLLAIGTSTGGPVALQTVLSQIPASFPLPILIVQHMPAAFTPAFANRLNSQCKISVSEAKTGDVLKAGHAYLAPGGKQMLLEGRSGKANIVIRDDDSERLTYKPSVDLTFGSAAKAYGGDVLSIILTGMGADGREGCRMLKQRGATIWAQDEETSVVYGMPQAVTVAGIAEQNFALDKIGAAILKEISSG